MQSPYELRPAQFRRVARITAEASANAGFYWQDLTNALADYTGGNAVVGEASPRLASLLRGDQVPIATSVPAGFDRPLGLVDGAARREAPGVHVSLARLHPLGQGERRLGALPA